MAWRVLVVEDNPGSLELVSALLEQAECEILTAEDGETGLRLAASQHPDLILMDLELPGISGYECTRKLKADPATAATPVVAITAFAMRDNEREAREAGCDEYLTKPLDVWVFRATLRRFLHRKAE